MAHGHLRRAPATRIVHKRRVAIRNAAARAVHLKEAKWRNDRQSSKFSGVFVAGREETACVFPLGREYRWATNGHPPSSFVYPRVARRTAFFPVTLGIVPGWSSFLPSPPPPPLFLSVFSFPLSLLIPSLVFVPRFVPSVGLSRFESHLTPLEARRPAG